MSPLTVPGSSLNEPVHPLDFTSRLFRVRCDPACPASYAGRLPWGSLPLRDFNLAQHPRGAHASQLRPRRFARPRRFRPRLALRVCFAPLPRPGFSLQGFSLPRSGAASSTAWPSRRYPPARCRRLPSSATRLRPDLKALHRAGIRLRDRQGLAVDRIRSPLGLLLLRVSLSEPGGRGHRPRRPGPFNALVAVARALDLRRFSVRSLIVLSRDRSTRSRFLACL